jgi:DNA polymerase-4
MTGSASTDFARRRWVLHVDLDQFIAAVEVLRNPDLVGKAVVVGGRGDPTERGVVSTASYEARAKGVGSGMPLRTLGYVVEVIGWDEAFLGVETDDPEGVAKTVHDAVFDATGLHCSVGIGDNKLRAKIATDFDKPQGIYRLTQDNWFEVMGDRGTDALWGIGKKISKRLAALGISTVRELADARDADLAAAFGPKIGPWLGTKGRGIDLAPVTSEPWVARSHSREVTFQTNVADWAVIRDEVAGLTSKVLADIEAENRPAVRAALKIRYAPFETHTVSAPIVGAPTFDPKILTSAAVALVDRLDHSREVRLIGVRLEMTPPQPL